MKKNDISKENDVSKKRDERRTHFIESFLDAEYPSESDRTPRAIVYLIGTVEENSEVTNKLTGKIKTLTWVLVILGLALLGITIYQVFCS